MKIAFILIFCALPVFAGERYLYVQLDKDASDQTKEEFRKWVLSLPPENWHSVKDWDTKDTNQIWSVNLDVEKPGSPWKPLTVTTNTAKTSIAANVALDQVDKIKVEAHSSTPTIAIVADKPIDPKEDVKVK